MEQVPKNDAVEGEGEAPEWEGVTLDTYEKYREFAKRVAQLLDEHDGDAEAVATLGSPEAPHKVSYFEQSTSDDDPDVRRAVLTLLNSSFMGDRHDIAEKLRDDEDPKVREAALAWFLGKTTYATDEQVKEGLASNNPKLQILAVKVLGAERLVKGDITSLMKSALESDSAEVRATAIAALHRVPDEERMGFLNDAFGDESASVREVAVSKIIFAPREIQTEG